MKDFLSPEEKLLRLIRGQKKQPAASDKNTAALGNELKQADSPSVPVSAGRQRSPTAKQSGYSLGRKIFSFSSLPKMLPAAFILSCLYLLASIIYPWVGLKNAGLLNLSPGVVTKPVTDIQTMIKPYEFYQEGTKNRKLFGALSSGQGQIPESGVSLDLIKDINLLGIISGDNPQAILEDTKTQKTYYCVKGQFVGDLQIEDIQEGKIIIKFRDRLFELYL